MENEIIVDGELSAPGEKKKARGFLKQAILLIPNFLKLLLRLFKDRRVPTTEKALLIGSIVYVISPLDLLPDFIPFLGQVDDLYLVSLVLLRLLAHTPDDVIRHHWEGGGDLAGIVRKIVKASQYVLPKRIRYILLGRVDVMSKVRGRLLAAGSDPDAIEVEREPQPAERKQR